MNKPNFQTTQIPIQKHNSTTQSKDQMQQATPSDNVTEKKQHAEFRTNVRFSKAEYEKIRRDAFIAGESIPVLLKSTYFKAPFPAPLMPAEDQRAALIELRRIGTNINQIAKHLNSGFREGWNEDFIQMRDSIVNIRRFVAGFCGDN